MDDKVSGVTIGWHKSCSFLMIGEQGGKPMSLSTTVMTHNKPLRYPECDQCPLYQAQECLIAPSRILIYFYCPVSEGFRPPEGLHTDLPLDSSPMANPAVAKEYSL